MKRLACCCLLFLSLVSYSQEKHVFSLGTDDFLLDGKPFQIISGELHPARIPREYWRHRIQMAKAMGCNTIAAYIFWNYHEINPGIFDFKTGNHDIAAFIRLCQEEKMWVLLRPGPYVCAEWDFGGLPPYLLKIPDIKIRCMDSRYMLAVNRYIDRLSKEIKGLQCTAGGPILMLQVENEYGSYGNDRQYMEELRKRWKKNGVNIPFYTSDGPAKYMLDAGSIEGAAIGLDSGGSEGDFAAAKKKNPTVPAFSGETYPGWLTHWGEKMARPDTIQLKREIQFLLTNKKSFNLYVIHGGTNFGLTAGANAFSPIQYQPDITSYDYDAPINEQGLPTAKYFMLRKLIRDFTGNEPPPVPSPIPVIKIPAIEMKPAASIWATIPSMPFVKSPQPLPMEMVDQNQGLILYRTKLIGPTSGKLTIWEPHDYALVFLDKVFIDTVFRDGGKWTIDLPKTTTENPVLEILVEGMGHINFAQFMIDRKGITERVTLNGITLMNWEMVSLPMDDHPVTKYLTTGASKDNSRPGNFFTAYFDLKEIGDTYFDLSHFSKGYVYVNGHNLGRYWNIGPQQRLYCPASWLKNGRNEIVIFDLHQLAGAVVSGERSLE